MATRTNNSGILGKNKRKESVNHADLKGDVLIDGKRWWASAWLKQSDNGPFYSLSFQEVTDQARDVSLTKDDEKLFF